MGFFDFFKKKSSNKEEPENFQTHQPVDDNSYLLEQLKSKIEKLGYSVRINPQYFSIIVNSELEIATLIIDNPENHPSILHLMIVSINPKYFPEGIEENIVGVGTTIHDKVDSVTNNYINTTFFPLINSFSDTHNPELDFTTITDDKEILWHPILGSLTLQGQWEEQPQEELFFQTLKEKLKPKLSSNKINWLKIYISKRGDGTIIGECNFNNEPWQEGLNEINKYAETWEMKTDFKGLKQFIVLKKCDKYDE